MTADRWARVERATPRGPTAWASQAAACEARPIEQKENQMTTTIDEQIEAAEAIADVGQRCVALLSLYLATLEDSAVEAAIEAAVERALPAAEAIEDVGERCQALLSLYYATRTDSPARAAVGAAVVRCQRCKVLETLYCVTPFGSAAEAAVGAALKRLAEVRQ